VTHVQPHGKPHGTPHGQPHGTPHEPPQMQQMKSKAVQLCAQRVCHFSSCRYWVLQTQKL